MVDKINRLIFFLLMLITSLAVFGQKNSVVFQPLTFSEAIEKAKAENKYIFLDAYTDWCVPCKRMEKEVFSEKKAARFFNPLFINVKFDMEKGEGVQLREKYQVAAFPTYLIITPEGDLVHKMIGYSPLDTFIAKVKKGMSEEYASESLRKKFLAGERSPSFLNLYKKVLTETYNTSGLQWLYGKLFMELPDEKRFDSSSWKVYKSIRSYKDTVFQFMLYNQDIVSKYVPKEDLVYKLKLVCFVTLFDHFSGKKPLEEEELNKLMNDIRFIPVSFDDDVNVVSRAILLNKKGSYDQLITLYEQFVSGLKINRTFWDKHLAAMPMQTPSQILRVKEYLIKSKEKCHPNSLNFYTTLVENYLNDHP